MLEIGRDLAALLVSTGPVGALVAGILVALALIVIVYAQVSGIFSDRRAAKQQNEFQGRLLESIRLLTETENRLRRENERLAEDVGRLTATVELLREQHRRVIDLLRRVMTGRVAPVDITEADISGAS